LNGTIDDELSNLHAQLAALLDIQARPLLAG
jgi:hypothetical protein